MGDSLFYRVAFFGFFARQNQSQDLRFPNVREKLYGKETGLIRIALPWHDLNACTSVYVRASSIRVVLTGLGSGVC